MANYSWVYTATFSVEFVFIIVFIGGDLLTCPAFSHVYMEMVETNFEESMDRIIWRRGQQTRWRKRKAHFSGATTK